MAGIDSGDQLRSLGGWLGEGEGLRGRVALLEGPPAPGTLGPLAEAVSVALGPGGAATAVATAIISWLRTRRANVKIKVTLPDRGSLELTAAGVSDLDAEALRRQVSALSALLESVEEQNTDTDPDRPALA
ncbi:hypothetical protein LRE75_07315 [Streptomyces sp. 372A]